MTQYYKKGKLPSCEIASNISGEACINCVHQNDFDFPWNRPVWSHPVKVWNPNNDFALSSPIDSYQVAISRSLNVSPQPVLNIRLGVNKL